MVEFILDESFQRYILQENEDDIRYWESWIREHPEASEAIESARETLTFITARKKQPACNPVRDQVYDKLLEKIKLEKRPSGKVRGNVNMPYYWYAASIVIVIGLAWGAFTFVSTSSDWAGSFLEVIVPQGQHSQLILPDMTKVWLNAGTTFKYPREFNKRERDVYIEGEAFFNVRHSEKAPFIVHLKDNLLVKVTGTEFNIKCYADDKVIETTLVKGTINLIKQDSRNRTIQEIQLHPNEMATYNRNENKLIIARLLPDTENQNGLIIHNSSKPKAANRLSSVTAWKQEELVFDDETFYEIAVKMERWFGVKIKIVDDILKEERFTGKFANKETVYKILDIINKTEPIQYQTYNDEIIISKRKNKPNY